MHGICLASSNASFPWRSPQCRKWAVSQALRGAWQADEKHSFICLTFPLYLQSPFIVAGQTLRTACKYVAGEIRERGKCLAWVRKVMLCFFNGMGGWCLECLEKSTDRGRGSLKIVPFFRIEVLSFCQPILKCGLFSMDLVHDFTLNQPSLIWSTSGAHMVWDHADRYLKLQACPSLAGTGHEYTSICQLVVFHVESWH